MSSNSSCSVRARMGGGGISGMRQGTLRIDQAAVQAARAGHPCLRSGGDGWRMGADRPGSGHDGLEVVAGRRLLPRCGSTSGPRGAARRRRNGWHFRGIAQDAATQFGNFLARFLVAGLGFVEIDAQLPERATHQRAARLARCAKPPCPSSSLSMALRMEASRSSILGSIDNSEPRCKQPDESGRLRSPSHYL
jgi:hypothetical protein